MVNKSINTVNEKEIKAVVVFTMRMTPDVYEKIKQSAFLNKRSIAKEIEFRLEKSLRSEN